MATRLADDNSDKVAHHRDNGDSDFVTYSGRFGILISVPKRMELNS